jgi:hypothetical protein
MSRRGMAGRWCVDIDAYQCPNETTQPLQLIGFMPQGAGEVWRFDETHKAEKIESQKIEDGAMVTVPPYSMTLLVIP